MNQFPRPPFRLIQVLLIFLIQLLPINSNFVSSSAAATVAPTADSPPSLWDVVAAPAIITKNPALLPVLIFEEYHFDLNELVKVKEAVGLPLRAINIDESFAVPQCVVVDGSRTNDVLCMCGDTDVCTVTTGLLCDAASTTKMKCSFGIATTTDGSTDTGEVKMRDKGRLLTDDPNDVILSGSTVQSLRMGRYVWTGSEEGGKPAYKRGNFYLYWLASHNIWCIGDSLGSLSVRLYWENADVPRPESSPSPTPVKASNPSAQWSDENIIIEVAYELCANVNGAVVNDNDCACGSAVCDDATGQFCFESSNKCTNNPCEILDGSSANENACTCGSSDCDSTTGLFCMGASNFCQKEEIMWCSAKPASGEYTMPRGSAPCVLSTHIEVTSLLTLASGGGGSGMAIISGNLNTRLFSVNAGNLTLIDIILEKGNSNDGYGAGIAMQANARVHLLRSIVRGCEAASGGGLWASSGVMILEGSTLESNKADGMGGGIFASDTKIQVKGGLKTSISNNEAQDSGGGFYLQNEGASLEVSGAGTQLLIDGNTAQHGGGGGVFALTAATITALSGSRIEVTNNEAKKSGGGFYLQDEGTNLNVNGVGTQLLIDKNTAQIYGGGVSALNAATITASSGSRIEVTNNEARVNGGGFYLQSEGARLDVYDSTSRLLVNNNMAKVGNGGGMALRSGAVVRVTAPSTFHRNTAAKRSGGGIGYDDQGGLQDGGSTCTRLSMYVFIDGDTNIHNGNVVSASLAHARTLKIFTAPNSPLFSPADQRDQIANKKTTWCVPCGRYIFQAGTYFQSVFLPGNSYINLTIPRSKNNNDDEELVHFSTEVTTKATASKTIDIPCAEQAVTLTHAHFEDNYADLNGGAMSTPNNYKNAFFKLQNVTFVNNRAKYGKGGAVRVSGAQTAIDIKDATFSNNQASSGGAVSIDSSASMRMLRADAANNIATNGDGGFLFSRFAAPILLVDVNIEKSTTDKNGGGGGLAVYSSQILFENCTINDCQAGKKGGGGILLDGEAEGHLFGGILKNNTAEFNGGHILTAASSLIVHGENSILKWPRQKPMFQLPYHVLHSVATKMLGGTTSDSGGSISCVASKSDRVLSFYNSENDGAACASNLYKYTLYTTGNGYESFACPFKGVYLGKGTTIRDSTATKNGGAVSANLCSIEMFNTSIIKALSLSGDGGAIMVSLESTLHVNKKSRFESNQALEGSGGAVSCRGCDTMSFSNGTLFDRNVAHKGGGALDLLSPKNLISSTGSTYTNNEASTVNGGAVNLNGGVNWMSISDTFSSNNAVLGSGGAMSAFGSFIHFDASTSCTQNRALKGGGGCILWEPNAINIDDEKWILHKPVIDNALLVSSNQALYGSELATPGTSLRIVNLTDMTTGKDNKLTPAFPQVQLLDVNNEVVRGEFARNVDVMVKLRGKDADLFGATISKTTSTDGTAAFNELGVQGVPKSGPHQLYFESSLNLFGGVGERFLNTSHVVSTFIKDCNQNLFLGESDQCETCPPNSVLNDGIKEGKMTDVCSCNENYFNENYFRKISDDEQTMSCTKCQARSTSPAGSVNESACKCDTDFYLNMDPLITIKECIPCPDNSILKSQYNRGEGLAKDVCACKSDSYRVIDEDNKMTCSKCQLRATSTFGSTSVDNCKCDDGLFELPDSKECKSCPANSVIDANTKIGKMIDICSCNENYYREINNGTSDKMSCTKCPSRSTAIKGSMTKTNCLCDDGLFKDDQGECVSCPVNSNLDDANTKIGKMVDVCSCNENYYHEIINGTDKMSCTKCPSRSTSSKGSTSRGNCTCNEGLFEDKLEECKSCPANSVIDANTKIGKMIDICSCNENYYREINNGTSDKMSCSKCPAESTSSKSSVAPTDCKCNEGFYPTDENHAACSRPDWVTADKCDDSQFLNNTSLEKFDWKCESCPDGGSCRGETTLKNIQALYGWSRCPVLDTDGKPLFEECVYSPSCLGAKNLLLKGKFLDQNKTDPATMNHNESCNGALAYSNETTRCSTCKQGYAPGTQGRCVQCDDSGGSAALTVLFFLTISLMFFLMIALKMRSSGKKKAAHSTIKRTFFTHLQMISIIMSLNVPWPSFVRDLLVGVSSVMSVSSQSSTFQCMNGYSVAEIYYGTLVLAIVLPVILAMISWAYWFVCVPQCPALGCTKDIRLSEKCIKKNPFVSTVSTAPNERSSQASFSSEGGFNWKSTRDGFVVTNVYFLYLISPSIIRMSFEIFQCKTLCAESLYVLAIDESEHCYSLRHQAFSFVVAVPTLILIPVSTVLALLYLRVHRHELKTNRKLILRFGLIFSGYASHRWFWEIFVILRKVVLILIVTFGRSNQSQLHFSLGSLVVILYLQERGKPFEDEIIMGEQQIFNKERAQNHQLHLIEIGSLVVLCTMSWVAVFFTLESSETIGNLVLSFLVIMSNLVFVLMCGYLGCRKFGEKEKLTKKLSAVFKRFGSSPAIFLPTIWNREDEEKSNDVSPQTNMSGVELAVFAAKRFGSSLTEEKSNDVSPQTNMSGVELAVSNFRMDEQRSEESVVVISECLVEQNINRAAVNEIELHTWAQPNNPVLNVGEEKKPGAFMAAAPPCPLPVRKNNIEQAEKIRKGRTKSMEARRNNKKGDTRSRDVAYVNPMKRLKERNQKLRGKL